MCGLASYARAIFSRHWWIQHHDPIETREIGLGLLQSFLGMFAIGDVDDDCSTERWRAVCRGNDK